MRGERVFWSTETALNAVQAASRHVLVQSSPRRGLDTQERLCDNSEGLWRISVAAGITLPECKSKGCSFRDLVHEEPSFVGSCCPCYNYMNLSQLVELENLSSASPFVIVPERDNCNIIFSLLRRVSQCIILVLKGFAQPRLNSLSSKGFIHHKCVLVYACVLFWFQKDHSSKVSPSVLFWFQQGSLITSGFLWCMLWFQKDLFVQSVFFWPKKASVCYTVF